MRLACRAWLNLSLGFGSRDGFCGELELNKFLKLEMEVGIFFS